MPWLRVFAAPVISVAAMGIVTFALVRLGINAWLAVSAGLAVYAVMLVVTGAFRGDDMQQVLRALPVGPLKRLLPAAG